MSNPGRQQPNQPPWLPTPWEAAVARAVTEQNQEYRPTSLVDHIANPSAVMAAALEAQQIVEDIYGSPPKSSSLCKPIATGGAERAVLNETEIIQSRNELQAALNCLSDQEKSEYLQAKQKCPHLVEIESCPDRYLAFDAWDAAATARRLTAYWTARHHHFGERAFLPMTQTGTGALSVEDVELLKMGCFMLLPCDRFGRAVLFHDRGRITSTADLNSRLRCLFYLLHVAATATAEATTDETVSINELVLMSVYSDKTRASSFDPQNSAAATQLLRQEIIPIRVKAIHIIMLTNRPILDNVVPATLEILQNHWPYLRQRCIIHTKQPTKTLLDDLEKKYGFDSEYLPKVPMGGRWTIGSFKRWRDDRLYHEQRILEKINKLQSKTYASKSSMSSILPNDGLDMSAEDAEEESYSDQDERRKRRAVDAMYARRRRVRCKVEMEGMQEQVTRLQHQQNELLRINEYLQTLLQQANALVQTLSTNKRSAKRKAAPSHHVTVSEESIGGHKDNDKIKDYNSMSLKKSASDSNVGSGAGKLALNTTKPDFNSDIVWNVFDSKNNEHLFTYDNPLRSPAAYRQPSSVPLAHETVGIPETNSEQPETKAETDSALVSLVPPQLPTSRQQNLLQSWHEHYCRYQNQVAQFVHGRIELQRAQAIATIATAYQAFAQNQQSQTETTVSQQTAATSSQQSAANVAAAAGATAAGSVVVNKHLVEQVWLLWLQQQRQYQPEQSSAHDVLPNTNEQG